MTQRRIWSLTVFDMDRYELENHYLQKVKVPFPEAKKSARFLKPLSEIGCEDDDSRSEASRKYR